MRNFGLLLFLVLAGCETAPSYETVSLLDYTTPKELAAAGLTPDKIQEMNNLSLDKTWGNGASFYEGYHKYQVEGFEVLVNPDRPDDLYLIKDGQLLLDVIQNDQIRLFKLGTTFPSPNAASVVLMRKDPAVYVANSNQIYYDKGLDGVDIVGNKLLWKGDKAYMNYIDFPSYVPEFSITKANINGKQCKPLVATIACCKNDQKGYTPYVMSFDKGWQPKPENLKLMGHCNSGDINQSRNELIEAIYENQFILNEK